MLPILNLGPLAVQTPGLIILLGIWIGLGRAEKTAHDFGIILNRLYSLVLLAIIGGLLGGRISYLSRNLAAFSADPLSIISLNPAMLDVSGGILTGLLTGLVYGQRRGLRLWPTLDALTPAFSVMLVAWGLANFASGDAFGLPARLPWSVELWGELRHPAQLYETLAALIILWVVWPRQVVWQRRFGKPAPDGLYFLMFIILSSGSRIFLEAFRGDSLLIFERLRVAQGIAWIILVFGLWLFNKKVIPFIRESRGENAS